MKTISGARQTYLDAGITTDAWFSRIVRTDGVTIGMTSHVSDITIGAVTYFSTIGYTPTAISSTVETTPGVVDIDGIMSSAGIPRADLENGLYDDSRIYTFITDYTNPVADDQKMMTGFLGKVRLEQGQFVAEFVSLLSKLKQNIGRNYKEVCDTDLGSSRCGVQLTPNTWAATTAYSANTAGDANTGSIAKPVSENGLFFVCTTAGTSGGSEPSWNGTIGGTTNDGTVVWTTIVAYTLTGSVTTTVSEFSFIDSSRSEDTGWWAGGKLTWTSGLNNGLSLEVKAYGPSGSPEVTTITLVQPATYAIAVTDTYTITAGCLKRLDLDCKVKFNNNINHQGFPYVPTNAQAETTGVR